MLLVICIRLNTMHETKRYVLLLSRFSTTFSWSETKTPNRINSVLTFKSVAQLIYFEFQTC